MHAALLESPAPWLGKTEDALAEDTYKYQSLKERNRHAQKKYGAEGTPKLRVALQQEAQPL